MCLNCGCGQPDERHGNEANIVAEDLRRAGEANGQGLATTVGNLQASLTSIAGTGAPRGGNPGDVGRRPTAGSRSPEHG